MPLFAGDLVTVERMVPATIYLIGEVKSPGALAFSGGDERITPGPPSPAPAGSPTAPRAKIAPPPDPGRQRGA